MSFEVTIINVEMYGDRLWFSNASFNGLFSMDPNTFEIRFETLFPGVDINKRLIHRWVFSYCNKLYFIPFTGQAIHIFNGDEITSISIEKKNKNPYYMFSNAVFSETGKKIYLMPMDNESDLQYLDLYSNRIYDVPSFRQHISKLDSNTNAEIQISSTYLLGNELYFLYGYKWLVKWNIEKECMDTYKVAPSSGNIAYDLLYDKKRLWLYFQNGDLAALDETDYLKLDIQFNSALGKDHSLICVSRHAGYIWFISDRAQMLFKCKDSGEIVERLSLKEILQRSDIAPEYTEMVCVKHINDILYIFAPSCRGVICMGKDGNISQIISNFCSDNIRNLYYEYFFTYEKRIAIENDVGLFEFLKYVRWRKESMKIDKKHIDLIAMSIPSYGNNFINMGDAIFLKILDMK